ncbi:hypothetical protein RN001_006209 [Aquatica leii]|uniref:Uncharacterized protein n=1 Tax=Aquatica leii TaxID=1421715 RepID=A0AAN7Q8N9_9COLE|nr:hypothetical protein RN001_006209 [Aquatica leii]
MTGKVAAVLLILIFTFAECAAGSCLSYGHSCWGGHGKRSGDAVNNDGGIKDGLDGISDTKWVLSRLLQAPLDMRPWKNDAAMHKHNDLDAPHYIKNEMSNEQESEALEGLPSNDDVMYVDEPSARHKAIEDKMRLFKMIKNINRLN